MAIRKADKSTQAEDAFLAAVNKFDGPGRPSGRSSKAGEQRHLGESQLKLRSAVQLSLFEGKSAG